MTLNTLHGATFAVVLAAWVPTTARADSLTWTEGPRATPTPIYGGETVATCAWPSAVFVRGNACTGSLVHPELVVYAAHCLKIQGMPQQIEFGESSIRAARTVGVTNCEAHPDFSLDTFDATADVAYCKLAEPVVDVPRVPILMGCEEDVVQVGAQVTAVGYGNADDGAAQGLKRQVSTVIAEQSTFIGIGEPGKGTCQGDSGGPTYIRNADGQWRLFAVTSFGNQPCGTGSFAAYLPRNVGWLEQASGVDITPCHDGATGTFEGGSNCGGFPTSPESSAGTWADACGGHPVDGVAAACNEGGGSDSGGSGGVEGDSGAEDAGTGGGATDGLSGGTDAGDLPTGASVGGTDGGGSGCRAGSPGVAGLAVFLGLLWPQRRRRRHA